MKRIIAVAAASLAVIGLVISAPGVVEKSVPAMKTVSALPRTYTEKVTASGSLSYIGQKEVTSALPLVIGSFLVGEGDTVEVGDRLATVDKKATASLIESLGQVYQLAVASSNLSAAVSLIPSEVVADCAGRVVSTAGNGAAVESGYSIVTIAATDTLMVTAAVSELAISRVCEGQRARFTCAAYPDTVFCGTVSRIASSARNRYNGAVLETVVDVVISPDREDARLKSGLTADVEILLSDPREICVLPYEAIGQDEAGEYVYVYRDGEAQRRGIFTGAEFSDGTEILKGVSVSDEVFASPSDIEGRGFIRMEGGE